MRRVLVANRGEIALRIVRACQELGLETVAVYTESDRAARHLDLADQAYHLKSDGYLSIGRLLEIAERAGADAVHPGYGFLAESAQFAKSCFDRGLTWIGPNAEAIRQMGTKTGARTVAMAANVPVVPGTTSAIEVAHEVVQFGETHGWPVAIKAASGGGGRGFVVVNAPQDAEGALAKARREGEAYFGSTDCYLESYLTHPRHIEIQVLADKHGNTIHLGERECSIQRRHQKLIEECPSLALTPELRSLMGAAAVRMARAVGYDSVGTVEFLLLANQFYFLEMNTRIQVEHTITELVYRCDLVKEQIRIADGEPLSAALALRRPEGWALECRINAEDPAKNFQPTPGLITLYRKPGGPGVRVDDAIYTGYRIPEQFDSLLAKVIAWGENRGEAIARMRRALREIVLEGVPTTVAFHRHVLDLPAFAQGEYSTHFVGETVTTTDLTMLAGDSTLNDDAPAELRATGSPVPAQESPGPFRTFDVEVNDRHFRVRIAEIGAPALIVGNAARQRVVLGKPRAASIKTAKGGGTIRSPMHATVQQVLIAIGAVVTAGQPLFVLEAMKMETEIPAPIAGVVTELGVVRGQTVERDSLLATVQPSGVP